MDILIKTLSREDTDSHADEFVEILRSEPYEYWVRENFLAELNGKYELSVVAISSDLVAGYIIASLKDKGPYIHKFMVRDTFRGKAIGKKMLDFFEEKALLQNHHTISLAVLDDNAAAKRFYEKNGFLVQGSRPDTKTGMTLSLMMKPLKR